MKNYRVNFQIKSPTVKLIGPDGKLIGIVPLKEALKKAQELDLDLVELAPQTNPPVCRIMDFNKFKYEQEKREREIKKQQRMHQLKEVRIKPRIEEHDYQTKLKQIQTFLKKGHKVRIRLLFRGRELAHPEKGKELMERIIADTKEFSKIEKPLQKLERQLLLILAPK